MAKPILRRLAVLIPALVLALVAIGLGAVSFDGKVESFQTIGFTADAAGGGLLVTEVEEPGTGLAAGDQILLVNGAQVAELSEVRGSLTDRAISALVVLRDGQLLEVVYERPRLAIDWPYVILALIAVGYLLIGLFTLIRDRRGATLLFYFWCLASAMLYLLSPTAPFDGFDRAIFLVDELARLLLAPLTLHLFYIFPRPIARRSVWDRLTPFLYLPAALLATLQLDLALFGGRFLFDGTVTGGSLATLDRLELVHLLAFVVAAIAVLAQRLRKSSQWEQHRQASWMALGLAAGYLPFLLLYVASLALDLEWPALLTTLAVLPLAIVPVTFAWAILRYRRWDIGVIVRDTVSLSLTLLIGVIGFSLANLTINRAIPEDLAATQNLLSFATGLAIAGLMLPTRRRIGSSIERLQYRDSYRKRRALRELGEELLHERRLDHLSTSLLEQIRDCLDIDKVNLLFAENGQLLPAFAQPGLPGALLEEGLDPELWERDVVTLSGIGLPDSVRSTEQHLFSLGYRYGFPMTVRDAPIGVVLAGYKSNGAPLSSDDVDLVRNVLNQAALAFENARLLDEVHDRLDEVDRLRQHNRQIIESSPAGIAVLDASGRITSTNHALAELTGRDETELVGASLTEVLAIDRLPEPGSGIVELSFTDEAGRERYLQLSASKLPAPEGADGRVLVVQDVSQRVAMEHELEEKERLAALGMLAAGVAHEVNTPITGISSYAQMLLAETPEGDPRRELLKKVERQTFRAASIVNNLLEFSRDRKREVRPVALTPLVDECLQNLQERIADKAVVVTWEPPADEIIVKGNDGELLQVLTNLTVNALDAVPAQDGALDLRLVADGRWARIEVEDNGSGIPPERLEKIFQPFYSTKLSKGGTGLGLSISYNIVRRHEGEMRVVSDPGRGTVFTVELPAS